MKRTLIIGNWKMHLNTHEASLLAHRLDRHIKARRGLEVVLAPSLLTLQPLSRDIDRRKFKLAAQNACQFDEGAYTGEVSFTMLRGLADYVIIGHSERRRYFHEGLETVRDKVQAAIRNGISPILCIGETKHEKAAGESRRVIHDQLTTALANLTPEEVERAVVAYEPVWAISTFEGELAKPDEVEKAFQLIRRTIAELYGPAAAEAVTVLYGGSVDEHTAGGYLALEDCDGLLIGAASLNYKKFSAIVELAHSRRHSEE